MHGRPLMWQMPLSMRFAGSSPRAMSRVKMAADRPYSVSLATRIASSASFTRIMLTTGPKDSSA